MKHFTGTLKETTTGDEFKVTLNLEETGVTPEPDPQPEPDPTPSGEGLPLLNGGKPINIYFDGVTPRSDRAMLYFELINQVVGGNGTRNDPLQYIGDVIEFKIRRGVIPGAVRTDGFELRLHIQNTGNCARVDPWRDVLHFDDLDEIFSYDTKGLTKEQRKSWLDVDKKMYVLIANVYETDTSGKLFIRQVEESEK